MYMKNKCIVWVFAILLITLVFNVLSFVKKDSAINIETLKVGGKQNMQEVKKLYESENYKNQQKQAIEQALSQLEMMAGMEMEQETDSEEVNLEWEILDTEAENNMLNEIEKIKETAMIHGDENARFTVLEYSELLCPYCKRQKVNATIENLIEKYPWEVNAAFRHFIVHGAAAKLAEAMECVAELWTEENYFDYLIQTFSYNDTVTQEVMLDIADELGIKSKDMEKCIDSGKYTEVVQKQTAEWRSLFGVSGTPGNVIIDNESGEFVLIPGAYPMEKFEEEIENLKNMEQ